MSKKKREGIEEVRLSRSHQKSEVLAKFFKEYGELAGWDEWITFLKEHPELEGFEWARALADNSSN